MSTAGFFQWPQWASVCCLGLLSCLLLLHSFEMYMLRRPRHALGNVTKDKSFAKFQKQYLVVYGLVMFADWLQGTHMYSLYQSYNMNVSTLFLTGFVSSLLFGKFVGILVDKYGRRNACFMYCILEIIINLSEEVPIMAVLMVGRVLGGISTSLLFSSFESWMVFEHRRRGFAECLMGETFALGSEINGIVAVLAGFAAQLAADISGSIGPFRAAVIVTAIAALIIVSWPENYGAMVEYKQKNACVTEDKFSRDEIVLTNNSYALGICYSLFEGAVYVFVFLWFPSLQAVVPNGDMPGGLVFSCFMLCIAIGGKLFSVISNFGIREEMLLLATTAASVVALLIPTVSNDYRWILGGFLVFEICVGLQSPCCATLRGKYFSITKDWRLKLLCKQSTLLWM
ncbi:Predicted sugar transporter [Plasmopara halstedii]|uniref:Molybdate-anion transporter n=1 Tax=Plasmopara halstedii TaxID=4781 RepID=A0A0P1ALT4_PLAHL|nr:Predicted sugar transporter [Plasmopara halstedii]CEG42287.1 Predicted sugar transporter [Plasmopara halstedii]|eukprot:XP_024578656.1 Predicted sugar transporter [Plasmopara halstedii]